MLKRQKAKYREEKSKPKRKRDRNREKKLKPSRLPLAYFRRQVLIEFLNLDFSKPVPSENISGELHMLIHRDLSLGSVENLKVLQDELIEVLVPIAKLPAGGLKRFKRSEKSEVIRKMQGHLQSLLDRINYLRFESRFVLLAGEKELFGLPNAARQMRSRDQGIFSWGSEWIVKTEFSAGIGYSPRRDFYGMIAEGLITGELARLRRCPHCQCFFVAREPRQIYCIPEHGRLYYDDPTRATERVYSSRRAKEERRNQGYA